LKVLGPIERGNGKKSHRKKVGVLPFWATVEKRGGRNARRRGILSSGYFQKGGDTWFFTEKRVGGKRRTCKKKTGVQANGEVWDTPRLKKKNLNCNVQEKVTEVVHDVLFG